MNIDRLIEGLRDPASYSHSASDLVVLQTHISIVVLAGPFAYKVKKPLNLGFLDFRTLERRLHFCREEVRLNRRLAPDVYHGVVPLAASDTGLRVHGVGVAVDDAVEYAVKMERLPQHATLLSHLERSHLESHHLERVARLVASFHETARGGDDVSRFGTLEVVAGNARENFEQSRDHVGRTVTPEVFERVRSGTEAALSESGTLIETRARRGVPRDTHGDLHLEHIYLRPDRTPPRDLVVIDCVEFSPRFRFSDPVSDIAFLTMDLEFRGKREMAADLLDRYFTVRDDPEGRELIPYYVAYRAVVRAKVEGLAAADPGRTDDERDAAASTARARWLLALGRLEPPERRPCLVLVGGLPGTGKSTLASELRDRAGFDVISSDRVRKRLAGLDSETSVAAPFGEGFYSEEWNRRTYHACLARATEGLIEGRRVVVDASFRRERWRAAFLDRASELAVPGLFLLCTGDPQVIRRRLVKRADGPSDADVEIYERVAERWEPASEQTERFLRPVRTDASLQAAVDRARGHLRRAGLMPN